MSIDARLSWLLEERAAPAGLLREAVEFVGGPASGEHAWLGPIWIDVMVRAVAGSDSGSLRAELARLGFELHSMAGTDGGLTATGRISVDAVQLLDSSPHVARVEAPRDLQPEIAVSIPACGATRAHGLVPPALGGQALVGIVDTGIDYQHSMLRTSFGGTRIVALWDQAAPGVAGGQVPYGRVYTRAEIDLDLAGGATPLHQDGAGHGTHVASIAAGAGAVVGAAPAADLVVVALAAVGPTLGRSKNAIDAVDWIVREAAARHLPVSINISQGMNGGGHVGSSILELALDSHCRNPGVAIVKSAGNEGEMRTHASGTLRLGAPLTFEITCQHPKYSPGQLEVWYDSLDDVELSVEPPSGTATPWVSVASVPVNFPVAGVNVVRIAAELDPEGTGDNLFVIFFGAGGSGAGIVPGTWRVHLRPTRLLGSGTVHAWLERTGRSPISEQLRFSVGSADPGSTISVPGTARRTVTVGSYVTTPSPPGSALVGSLSSFSSIGPTRYGLQKPDLVAPGEFITAARSAASSGAGPDIALAGTSMAAPHVAGAAAILLSEDATLTGEQIRQILVATARPTVGSPNSLVGAGCLDIEAAVALVRSRTLAFPVATLTRAYGSVFEVHTLAPSTAALVYDPHPGRVLAGRRSGSIPSLALGTSHTFDLSAAGKGTWHFEVNLFSSGGWRTTVDASGGAWSITVP